MSGFNIDAVQKEVISLKLMGFFIIHFFIVNACILPNSKVYQWSKHTE